MNKKHFGFAAAIALTLGVASQALAASWTNCTVSDIQSVKVGATDYFIFKACGFFWSAPTSTAGRQHAETVVTSAKLSGRGINVQCAMNGGSCTSFSTNVYNANAHGLQTIFPAETINMRDP